MPLLPGTRLGPYRIAEVLGESDTGEIYLARDVRLSRMVALRVLPSHLASEPEAVARFEVETRAIAALAHPNVLTVHDIGRDEGVVFAVTETPEGSSLRELVRGGPLEWREAVRLTIEIAEGLSAAHQHEIVHRGLRPEVIRVSRDGHVKIHDFGIEPPHDGLAELRSSAAEAGSQEQPTTPLPSSSRLHDGVLEYLAPEQVRGETVGPVSDIFALGCLLSEMMTGTSPFASDTAIGALSGVLVTTPPDLESAGVPRDVSAIASRCLEKRPEDRFQSAGDLAFALRQTLESAPQRPVGRRRKGKISALAVLPFENASEDPTLDYLSDGVSEALIQALSHVPKLKVMARSTVFRFRARLNDPVSIGRELGLDAVLVGRVSAHGDSVAIRCELVDVADGSQLWGEQFHRELTDVFSMQEQIAEGIASALKVRLTGAQRKRVVRRHTSSNEAYQFYLKGRFHWNRRAADSFQRAIEFFQRAIESDPSYALAYTGLADCYNVLGNFALMPPDVAYPKARSAAMRALEIDDALAEAHCSLAFTTLYYDWDPALAEKRFLKAIKLNPGYSIAHQWYAINLSAQSRLNEAVDRARGALELDPLSLSGNMTLGWMLYEAGRFREAIEQETRTLELDDSFAPARFFLAMALCQDGQPDRAIEELQAAEAGSGRNPRAMGGLGYVFGSSGFRRRADAILSEMNTISASQYIPAYEFAMVFIGLGDSERAIDHLERACEEHSGWLLWLGVDPVFDSLRKNPRFVALVQRVAQGRVKESGARG